MTTVHVDVAIIGSGAGGGTVAATLAKLAEQGKRVVVFEKGPRFDHKHFSGKEIEMSGALYNSGGGFMVANKTVSLAFAEGYGGSSRVYTGTSLMPPKRVIDKWNIAGLTHEDLVPRAERFLRDNNAHQTPEEDINENNWLFKKGCDALGLHAERFPVSTKGCQGSSLCNLGCPNNAKQGAAVVQLPQAEAKGVEVVTHAEVTAIREKELSLRIDGTPHPWGYKSEWQPGEYTVKADVVVLCAGAIYSPTLLLRSGFGNGLPALGRYFTCQPAHILVGEHEKPITNAVGHPKTFIWEERVEQDKVFLETCMYFPFVTAKNLTGFGPDHESLMRSFDRLQMILVLACDEALPEHRVAIDKQGNPVVHYTLTEKTIESMVKGTRAAARIFFAAGAKSVHAPSARPTRLYPNEVENLDTRIDAKHFLPGSVSVSAAHLMGGCRMGEQVETSVTNAHGQVHGAPWLYVADASLFPTALEINPYITIMTLAERVAEAVTGAVTKQ